MIRFISILFLLSSSAGYKIFDDTDDGDEEIVEIEPLRFESRYRRSGNDDLPEDVEYKLSVLGNSKHLKLKKNEHFIKETPMYRAYKGRLLERKTMSKLKYAPYQDPETGASVLLHCFDKDSCKMYGTFFHDDSMFRIQPDSAAMTSKKHRIRKLKHNYNLNRDTVALDNIEEYKASRDTLIDREERDTGVMHHVVELLMFLDDSVSKFFLKMSKYQEDEALEKMKMYYTLIANDMDLRYASINTRYPKFKLNVMINGFVYAKSMEDMPWLSNYVHRDLFDAERALGQFAEYQTETMKKYPIYDHAMQFSRRNLAFFEHGWQTSLLGIAFRGTTCYQPSAAVSIIEDSVYGSTGQIATHELGHSLGAHHDSEAGCKNSDQYIMAAVVKTPTRRTAKNTWKMSDCSAKEIYKQLSRKENSMCTLKNSYTKKSYEDSHSLLPAGRIYSLEEQCKLKFGPSSYVCKEPNKEVCYYGIYCKKEGFICLRVPALPGSTCGQNRVCDKTRCVKLKPPKPTAAPPIENILVLPPAWNERKRHRQHILRQ